MPTRRTRRFSEGLLVAPLCVACLLAFGGLGASSASAQAAGTAPADAAAGPTDQDQMKTLDEEARERFELGRTFYDAGRFQQAAEEFGEAYKLSGRPQLLYNMYVANRDAANWQPALDALRGYLEQVPDAPDRINLRARLASLEQQATLQKEQAARAEEERKRLQAAPRTQRETQHSKLPWIVTAGGGALLVGSIATGVMAKHKASDLDRECAAGGTVCAQTYKSDVSTQRTLAITTDVLWSVGAATAITGLVLWWTGALDSDKEVPVAFGASPYGVSSTYTVRY